jgi:ABC-type bacteriocin/lantibiotic exporter with double-glycine peptidase domain
MTIRDNILFDQPIDEDRYVKTVMSCCLERDFELLKSGDLSEIGERGINLSGG